MATYTAPTTRTSGELITASIWNTDLVENIKYFKGSPTLTALTTTGAITAGGNVSIPATSKLYLDGGSDTYVYESAANRIRFTTGGVDQMVVGGNALELLGSTSLIIPATQRIYLDGGGNTFLLESGGDTVDLYCGGTLFFRWQNSGGQYVESQIIYNSTTGAGANMVCASGGGLQRSTSSIRYKHDVETLSESDAMAAILAMRPVTYRGKTDEDQRRHIGFIAEEMQQIAPLLCTYDEGGEDGTPNYVTYDRVTAYLVSVVQQQQAEIDALKARLK
jgi:hypothetical protein